MMRKEWNEVLEKEMMYKKGSTRNEAQEMKGIKYEKQWQ